MARFATARVMSSAEKVHPSLRAEGEAIQEPWGASGLFLFRRFAPRNDGSTSLAAGVIPSLRQSFRRLVTGADAARGVAAIEFGVIAPVLVLMMISAIDLSLGIYRKMQVQNAAQAGLEYVIVHGFDVIQIASAVTSATSFSGVSASPAPSQFCGCASSTGIATMSCSSTCSGGSTPGTYVAVSAQATYSTLLPYPGIANSFNFTAKSTVRLK